jgi:hypothetical protein
MLFFCNYLRVYKAILKVSIERHIMSKKTGGWNGYDPQGNLS